jgi:hypothetical protein
MLDPQSGGLHCDDLLAEGATAEDDTLEGATEDGGEGGAEMDEEGGAEIDDAVVADSGARTASFVLHAVANAKRTTTSRAFIESGPDGRSGLGSRLRRRSRGPTGNR